MIRHRWARFTLPFLILMGTNTAGQAKDYPYSGYFAFVNSELPGSLDVATCASSFFDQRSDGTAISYHIDMAQFEATKAVRYLEYNRSQCTYNEFRWSGTCASTFDTDKTVNGQTIINVIDSIRGNYIWSTYYATVDDAKARRNGGPFTLFRCPFDAERITAAITGEISKLGIDERNKITWPSRELLTAPAIAEIMKSVGLWDKTR